MGPVRWSWLLVPFLAACVAISGADAFMVGSGSGESSIDASSPPPPPPPSTDGAADPVAGDSGPDGGDAGAEAAATYRTAVLSDDPIGYWRLGEQDGTTALDETAGQHNGTYGLGFVLGTTGAIANDPNPAVTFNRPGLVVLGSVFDFPGRAPFSIEEWIRPSSVSADYRFPFAKETLGFDRHGYAFYVEQSGVAFERWQANTPILLVAAPPPTDAYTHLVGTYDGTTLRFYVNGEEKSAKPDSRAVDPVSGPACIGASQSDGTFGFAGAVDEVAVYDKALAPARVKAHFELGHR